MVVKSLSTECKFCGHFYINPCDGKRAKSCPNVKLAERPVKAPPPAPKKKARAR